MFNYKLQIYSNSNSQNYKRLAWMESTCCIEPDARSGRLNFWCKGIYLFYQ